VASIVGGMDRLISARVSGGFSQVVQDDFKDMEGAFQEMIRTVKRTIVDATEAANRKRNREQQEPGTGNLN
jgi:hypothetical protein